MPDATVNIGGDASGGLAAVAAMQGAIDSMHGRTLTLDVQTRGGPAVAGMASDLGRVGDTADRVGRSARGMGDNFDRAGRSARGAGDQASRIGDHVGRAANEAERMRTHMDAVNNIMSGGAPGAVQHAQAMRQMAAEAGRAQRAIGGIGASTQQAQRAITAGDSGGFKAMGANAHAVTVEVMGIYRNTRQAITAAGEAGQAFSSASGHTSQMGTDLARTGARAGEAGKELARLGESGKELARVGDATRNIGGGGNSLSGMDLAAKGLRDSLAGLTSGFEDVGSTLGGMAGVAGAAARPLMMVGMAAGVGAIGMGALGAAVAGVGLAGVAEDFAHNSQLMNKGQDAIRGFNKEFSRMRSETSASGMPAMDGLSTSIKGVGHELAQIGAANMAPTLQHASELAGSLTQTMKQLAPAIGPSEQALTSLAGAALGAFGNSAPEIARFANVVTQNAGGLQSAAESVVRGGSALGGGLVQAVSAAAPFLHGAANVAAWGTDAVSGAFDIPSDFSDKPGPDGSMPNSIDTGIPDGMGGTVKKPGSSMLDRIGSGASKLGAVGFAAGLLGGPFAEISAPVGGAIGAIAGGVGGAMGVDGLTPGTSPLGDWSGGDKLNLGAPQSQKSMGLSSRPGRYGDFGPGSGGPATPPGPSGPSIYEQQFREATGGYPSTGPMPSGVGAPPPRVGGPGSAGGGAAIPTSMAPSLGVGSIQPFNNMMQAAQAQVAGGGAQTGQAMVQHVQKAVQVAAPAAQAGGAAMGGGVNTGLAQGMNSTQNVVDTVTIKHSKHIIDLATAVLGIHSPSTEFDWLGRMTMTGFGQGFDRQAHNTFGSLNQNFGARTAQLGKSGFGYDNIDGSAGTSVSVGRNPIYKAPTDDSTDPQQARSGWLQSLGNRQGAYNPGSDAWWGAHNNRADELMAKRQANHERALSQIGAVNKATGERYRDPFRDPNSALNNTSAFRADDPGRPVGDSRVGHASARRDSQQGWNRNAPLNLGVQPGPNQRARLPRVGPGSSGAAMSPLAASRLGVGGLPEMLNRAGQNSALGLSQGLTAHIPKIQAAGAAVAGAGHTGYKKKDKQASPSAAWADMAGNSVAGAVGGMNAGAPALAAAGAGAAAVMQAATSGPMADAGLAVGYTWAQNVETGVSTQIKKANYQSLGLPSGIGQSGMLSLAATGLLTAGAGASGYKTPGNAPGVVTLPAASASSGGNRTVTVNHNFDLGGQVVQAVTQITLDMFGMVTDAIALQPSS